MCFLTVTIESSECIRMVHARSNIFIDSPVNTLLGHWWNWCWLHRKWIRRSTKWRSKRIGFLNMEYQLYMDEIFTEKEFSMGWLCVTGITGCWKAGSLLQTDGCWGNEGRTCGEAKALKEIEPDVIFCCIGAPNGDVAVLFKETLVTVLLATEVFWSFSLNTWRNCRIPNWQNCQRKDQQMA